MQKKCMEMTTEYAEYAERNAEEMRKKIYTGGEKGIIWWRRRL